MRRYYLHLLPVLLLMPVTATLAATTLTTWSGFFKRQTGWQYADAAYSAPLPRGQRLWLFGDSIISGWPRFARNSIAYQFVSQTSQLPCTENFKFFVRDAHGRLLDVSSHGGIFGREWFPSSTENLSDNDPHKTWQWPSGIVVTHQKIILFYTEYHCTEGNIANGCKGPWHFAETKQYIGLIENGGAPLTQWHLQLRALNNNLGINWGSGLLVQRKYLLIFGRDNNGHLFAAKSAINQIMNSKRWFFLTKQGWQRSLVLKNWQLKILASDVPTEYTIHQFVVHKHAMYFLVQGQPFINNDVIIRLSNDWQHWASIKNKMPRSDVIRIDLNKIDPAGADPRHMVYAIKGQTDLAPWPDFVVSYFSTKTNGIRFVRLNRKELHSQITKAHCGLLCFMY